MGGIPEAPHAIQPRGMPPLSCGVNANEYDKCGLVYFPQKKKPMDLLLYDGLVLIFNITDSVFTGCNVRNSHSAITTTALLGGPSRRGHIVPDVQG